MSRLVWEYEGANEEKHGEQCVFVGDKVHHDSHGEGIAVRMALRPRTAGGRATGRRL